MASSVPSSSAPANEPALNTPPLASEVTAPTTATSRPIQSPAASRRDKVAFAMAASEAVAAVDAVMEEESAAEEEEEEAGDNVGAAGNPTHN